MAQITYANKEFINENANIPAINKVQDTDLNDIKNVINTNTPVGSISMYAGSTAPSGWLICDGSAVSRTDYADLFSVIGTTYGTGNGSTTFNLPNLKGRVPVGIDSSDTTFDTLGETGGSKYLQAHKHMTSWSVTTTGAKGNNYDGMPFVRAGGTTADSQLMWTGTVTGNYRHMKDWNNNDILEGNSGNLQPYIVLNYIISY